MKIFSKSMLLTSVVGTFTIMSCNKDVVPEPTNTFSPTTGIASLNNLFADLGVHSQNFTIDNSTTQTVTGDHGTILTFPANCFVTYLGGPVSGNVNIELKEIYDKKSMLLSNITTNAELYPTGPKEPLISGGEFYVNATQGSATLKLAPGQQYTAFLPSATAPNPNMSYFKGSTSTMGILWSPNIDSSAGVFPSAAPQGYFAYCDSLRWGNADAFMNAPNYTNITLNLSGTFDPTQMKAMVWYDNVKTVWSFYGAFNSATSEFPDNHTATGVPVHIIVLSVKDGLLYTAIIATTVTSNAVYNISLLATDETTFTNSITALP